MNGWDAATWRLGRADPRWRAPIVALLVVGGKLDHAALAGRLTASAAHLPALRTRLVADGATGHLLREPDPRPVAEGLSARRLAGREGPSDLLDAAEEVLADLMGADPGTPSWGVRHLQTAPHRPAGLVVWFDHALTDGAGAVAIIRALTDEASPAVSIPAMAGREPNRAPGGHRRRDRPMVVPDPMAVPDVGASGRQQACGEVSLTRLRARADRLRQARPRPSDGRPSTNDVIIAALVLAAAEATGRRPLAVNVPVDMRPEGNGAGTTPAAGDGGPGQALGNRLAVMRLLLVPAVGGAEENLAGLAQQVQTQRRWWWESGLLRAAEPLARLSTLLPPGLVTALLSGADLTVSSLRGLGRVHHLLGYPIVSAHPVVPPLGADIAVAVLGYAGTAHLSCRVSAGIDAVAILTRALDLLDRGDEVPNPVHRPRRG